eukprot:scaffold74728_cov33-Prasinocladus_malaysianus.AAC.1
MKAFWKRFPGAVPASNICVLPGCPVASTITSYVSPTLGRTSFTNMGSMGEPSTRTRIMVSLAAGEVEASCTTRDDHITGIPHKVLSHGPAHGVHELRQALGLAALDFPPAVD